MEIAGAESRDRRKAQ